MDKNQVSLIGYLSEKPKYDHENHGKKIYKGILITGMGKKEEHIPFLIEEKALSEHLLIDFTRMYELIGEIRSRLDSERRPEQYLKVNRMDCTESWTGYYRNEVTVRGQLKRPPRVRITGNGAKITSICLSVARQNSDNNHDSVICVGFRKYADEGEKLLVGEVVTIEGRLSVYHAMSNDAECLEVHISNIERESK